MTAPAPRPKIAKVTDPAALAKAARLLVSGERRRAAEAAEMAAANKPAKRTRRSA